MNKKRKIIFSIVAALVFMLICITTYVLADRYYFSKVILSGSFDLKLENIAAEKTESIKVFGYSPFGKIQVLSRKGDAATWHYGEHGNMSSICIFLGDSIATNYDINIITSGNDFQLKNLLLKPKESTDITEKIRPAASKWNIIKNMLYWREARLLGIAVLLTLFIYLALWFVFRKHRNISNVNKVFWLTYVPVAMLHVFFHVYTGYYLVTSGLLMLVLLALLAHAVMLIIELLKKKKLHYARMTVFSIIALFFLLELIFVLAGVKSTSLEKRFKVYYYSQYKTFDKDYFQTWKSNHWLKNQEYAYFRTINTENLSDKEHPVKKSPDEYRIIGIGDSFTESDGAHADSTWLKFLERNLNKYPLQKKLTYMNAGVCGSDPAYSYVMLRDKLLKYQPDLVILAVNASDVYDIVIRGGMERFQPDGSIKFYRKPWWEPIYAMSRISRLFYSALGYNELLYKNSADNNKFGIDQILLILDKFDSLAIKNNFKFITVLHPFKGEIDANQLQLKDIVRQRQSDKKTETFDLLEYFISVEHINSSNSFHYFWEIDGHHNAKGYEAFARGVEWKLKEMGVIDSLISKIHISN